MGAHIVEKINPNDPRTEGEAYLLEVFRESDRFDGWTVFEEPHINSMKPDIVMLHPQKGIIIIEVKDWNLASSTYLNDGYVQGTDGRPKKKDPVSQVENYKSNILKSELKNSVALSEVFDRYYGCIETVVYFHKSSKKLAEEFCSNNCGYTKIWVREDIDYIANPHNRLNSINNTYALARDKSVFNKEGILEYLVEELKHVLQYADYNYERREPYILTTDQRNLTEKKPGSIRRWSGVAGSGKSLVLAEKGVQALKDNKRVLVLTFNITLRHYLRDLFSQQFGPDADGNDRSKLKRDLTIIHFHSWLKTFMAEHQITCGPDDEEDFTARWIDKINGYLDENRNSLKHQFNYDYILIDEGQDFRGDWIRFLKQFFTKQGELFIVYDKAQDIYENGVWIEDPEQIRNIGFKGRPGTLRYTHRLPSFIVSRISGVRKQLQVPADDIFVAERDEMELLQRAEWHNYRADTLGEKLNHLENAVTGIRKNNTWEDITILTTNENTGAEIVSFFDNKNIPASHVYDMNRKKNQKERRAEKWKFQGGTGRLKISSYHSFKGWQTPNVILILDSPRTYYNAGGIQMNEADPQNVRDALFISMSRIKGKAETGECTFVCLNYLPEYDGVQTCF